MKKKIWIKKLNNDLKYALIDSKGETWAEGYLDLETVLEDLEANKDLYEYMGKSNF